ncbi:NAD-dependent epimerase/dehydratase family protein [Mangrovivirga sp. M17]|uniref:NAD-dependent epimerase/dehydratase family protein n=1 Tax=Mangrovivirga halotolerans TaxID=2993936 RepID=A0ABT3RPU6_9BACT|nr:NAD-dependent epimerase/dehydratase family protein [Mangrovivirga halotolerans]MCX2743394.1 NAD-dependent epimerase/dehydratase family protein [Mangrovivirga halotolerans]
MAKSLVTGGAGFIGAHVVDSLLQLGHEVVVLDDLSGGFIENVNKKALFIEGSICDDNLINDLFEKHNFDYVYHLAAYAAEGLSHFIRKFNYNNNLMGSINLINASVKHKIKCFVFTSSIAVYGTQVVPMIETATPMPEDPYGVAKYAIELDLKSAHEMFGLDYIVFRPHNVYGSLQNIGDRYRNVIGIFMNQLMKGNPLTVFGDGSQTRAFSYIDDVAPYIAKSVNIPEAYNEVFNIGGDTDYSVKELAETVMKVMGIEGEVRNLEARNEVIHAYADHSKARKVFGITPDTITDLETGLTNMAEWVKMNGVRKTPKFENIEILENLPKVWLED